MNDNSFFSGFPGPEPGFGLTSSEAAFVSHCSWTTSGLLLTKSTSSTSVLFSELKALKSYSRNRFSRSVAMTYSYPGNISEVGVAQLTPDESGGEFSGMGPLPSPGSNSLKVTHR